MIAVSILLFTTPFILFLIVNELSMISVYGWYVSEVVALQYMNISPDDIKTYGLNPDMIFSDPYISKLGFGVVCKYYVNKVGPVPRWSPLHNRINDYHKYAKDKFEMYGDESDNRYRQALEFRHALGNRH